MKTALSILGLSFDGFNLVSKLKALAAWFAVSIAISAAGYVAGRIDGAALSAHSAEKANAVVRDEDFARSFADDDFNRATIAADAAAEANNEEINASLATPEPHDRNLCLSGDWLRRLDSLK